MRERELRALIEDVRSGSLPRRSFIQRMVGLGLTAPMASMLLMHAGVAQAQPMPAYKPTKRGGGGALKALWWQGATLLQPAFRERHQGPGRLAHLLRAAGRVGQRRQPRARSSPPRSRAARTAASPPTASRSPGSSSRASSGTTASRSPPTTASSPGSTSSDPATAAVTIAVYKDVTVEKVDDHTIRVLFAKPTPFWADRLRRRRAA